MSTLTKKGRWVHCYECGSRQEKDGICRICGHKDDPILKSMVPDVLGKTKAAATKLIKGPEAQLVLGTVTEENSAEVAAGKVISSDPTAGTQLTKNAPVDIVVSLGPAE